MFNNFGIKFVALLFKKTAKIVKNNRLSNNDRLCKKFGLLFSVVI